jgi:hypothetical protein
MANERILMRFILTYLIYLTMAIEKADNYRRRGEEIKHGGNKRTEEQ